MEERKIPDNPRPWWTCYVNGKKYKYRSGTTADVPNEVAAIIDENNRAGKYPPAPYIPSLPAIRPEDEGKVLKIVNGQYVLAEEEGGGTTEPFVVNGTVELIDDAAVLTLDCTAESLYAAVIAGKTVRLIPNFDEAVLPIAAIKTKYDKYSFGVMSEDGIFFSCTEIDGTEFVVLTASIEQ